MDTIRLVTLFYRSGPPVEPDEVEFGDEVEVEFGDETEVVWG